MAGERQFYQLYFQEPGKAEAELEADVRSAMLSLLYSASGDPPAENRWRFLFGESETLMDTVSLPDTLPDWLTEQDIDFYAREFERTGFRGGLNWYRNIDRNWELTPFLSGAKLRQPLLFVAGERDGIMPVAQTRRLYDAAGEPKELVLIPGADHNDYDLLAGKVMVETIIAFLAEPAGVRPRAGEISF